MKNVILCSCLILASAVTPAQAFSRHLFHHHRPIFHNPAVQQLLNLPFTIPTSGNLTPIGPGSADRITVDSAVQTSITATKQNLDSASTTLNDLLQKNGITASTPIPSDRPPVVSGVPIAPKTGPIR
jgi:hypothetical protein